MSLLWVQLLEREKYYPLDRNFNLLKHFQQEKKQVKSQYCKKKDCRADISDNFLPFAVANSSPPKKINLRRGFNPSDFDILHDLLLTYCPNRPIQQLLQSRKANDSKSQIRLNINSKYTESAIYSFNLNRFDRVFTSSIIGYQSWEQ